jgi:hypothetical protein
MAHLSKDESVRIAKETKALILANKGRLSIKAFIDEAVEEKVEMQNQTPANTLANALKGFKTH